MMEILIPILILAALIAFILLSIYRRKGYIDKIMEMAGGEPTTDDVSVEGFDILSMGSISDSRLWIFRFSREVLYAMPFEQVTGVIGLEAKKILIFFPFENKSEPLMYLSSDLRPQHNQYLPSSFKRIKKSGWYSLGGNATEALTHFPTSDIPLGLSVEIGRRGIVVASSVGRKAVFDAVSYIRKCRSLCEEGEGLKDFG